MKVIRSYAELYELQLRLHKFDIYRKSETYKTALPQWNTDQNIRISKKINRYNKKCGCSFGNFVMSIILAAYLFDYFSSGGTLAATGLVELIELVVYTFAGAITGRILGLFYARWQLIKFVKHLL